MFQLMFVHFQILKIFENFHHGGSNTKHTYKSKHKTQHKHTMKIVKKRKNKKKKIKNYELITMKNL